MDGWLKLNQDFVKLDNSDETFINWNTSDREYYLGLTMVAMTIKFPLKETLYLEDLGYSSKGSKTKHLLSHYLDKERTIEWLNEISKWEHRDTPYFLPTKEPAERYPGNCLIGFDFRLTPKPSLLVISRAVEMPAKGGADLIFFSGLSKIICDLLSLDNLELTWYIDMAWVTSRTARFFLIQQHPKTVVYKNSVFEKGLKAGWDKFFLGDQKFSYSAGKFMQKYWKQKRDGLVRRTLSTNHFSKEILNYIGVENG